MLLFLLFSLWSSGLTAVTGNNRGSTANWNVQTLLAESTASAGDTEKIPKDNVSPPEPAAAAVADVVVDVRVAPAAVVRQTRCIGKRPSLQSVTVRTEGGPRGCIITAAEAHISQAHKLECQQGPIAVMALPSVWSVE